ncbi:peptidoglycan editing factor PgeF [Carboxydothermus ferrireducens]|nr:peptidoglycan editing factor PgeF [Carboxydothermus ferrireducens]
MEFLLKERKGLKLFFFKKFQDFGIDAFFTTRPGGQSSGPYQSFNLALHVGDEQKAVIKNRELLAAVWDLDLKNFVAAEQVHGTNIALVDHADGGRGMEQLDSAVKKTDGLITREKNLGLLTFYADCVPLYFFSPDPFILGVAHAGWRGTLTEIGAKMVYTLTSLGAKPQNIICGIGPAIGPCCYEVGDEVAQSFLDRGYPKGVIKKEGKYFLNLWEINSEILIKAGIQQQKIEILNLCTSCNPDLFFSYRRDGGVTGRMAAGIIKREVGYENFSGG